MFVSTYSNQKKVMIYKIVVKQVLLFSMWLLMKLLAQNSEWFFKLYCIDYAITVVPISHLFPPLPSTSYSLRQSPHHCSCPWVMCISSLDSPFPVLSFTFPWLFCNYLFARLNPLTSLPIPPHTPPICQPSKCSLYP